MITCIIIVGIAIAWLMRESDWLRVNLMGARKPLLMLPAGITRPEFTTPEVIELPFMPVLLLGTYHHLPATFEPLAMPEFKGEVNILCKME